MKAFAVLATIFAAVAAEADPALLYSSGLGFPYAYSGFLGYNNIGLPALKSAPCVNAANQPVACAAGYSTLLPYATRLIKREAEAEADPALLLAGGYSALPYSGIYGTYPWAYSLAAPAALPAVAGGYAAAGRYVANSAGTVHVAKREAEAEADPALLLAGGYSALPYSGIYGGYPWAYSLAAPAALPAVAGGYAAAGRYVANSAGTVHVAKREAEADPALLLAGGYSALPYSGIYGAYPYAGVYGLTHSSNLGICTNYVGQQVPC